MLFNTNHIITIKRLSSGEKKTWSDVYCELAVYINQIQEEINTSFDSAGSFLAYRMMTNGDEDILLWDRITDENGKEYIVKSPASVSNDLTWKHAQYILFEHKI